MMWTRLQIAKHKSVYYPKRHNKPLKLKYNIVITTLNKKTYFFLMECNIDFDLICLVLSVLHSNYFSEDQQSLGYNFSDTLKTASAV